jgi:glutamate-1-semialdehyde 2,1-aminomutase
MLKMGYLAGQSVYVCVEHTDEVISAYLEKLEPILSTIGYYEKEQKDISQLLEGPVCHGGFKRLN